MNLNELRQKKAKLVGEAEGYFNKAKAESRSMNADETKDFDAAMAEVDSLNIKIAELEKIDERAAKLVGQLATLKQPEARKVPAVAPAGTTPVAVKESRAQQREREVETAQISGSLRNFPNTSEGRWSAMRFGMWAIAAASRTFGGGRRATRYCQENGLLHLPVSEQGEERAIGHQENINYSGGYLVPDEFNNNMIVLREMFGVFRKFAKIIPMKGDTSSRPRRTGGLTPYFVGEGAAGTASQKSWDLVSLQAKKLMALSLYTSELNEDAVINIGDDLAGEIAYAFAKKEDECGFLGDGTSTYGGIIGLTSAFSKQGTQANQAGTITLTGSAWASIVLSDFNNMIARLPQYADTPNVSWFCHKTFYHQVMQKLMYAAGGNKTENIAAGTAQTFMGYPVNFSQTLPKVYAAAGYPVFLGDLSLGVDFGDRRAIEVAFSNSATIGSTNAFAQDALAIRGTERFDINVHDVGNFSATATSRVPGPIIAGYQA